MVSVKSAHVNAIGGGLKIGISSEGCDRQVGENQSWSKVLGNSLHQSLVCLLKY